MNQFFFPFSFASLLPLPRAPEAANWWAQMKIESELGDRCFERIICLFSVFSNSVCQRMNLKTLL